MPERDKKVIITGAAGLVGQNLVHHLLEMGFSNIVAVDKHEHNLKILSKNAPGVHTATADLSEPGDWMDHFQGARCLFLLQAQITGTNREVFERNTVRSTELTIKAAKDATVPFTVCISSSVLNSVAHDDYVRSKKLQEEMVAASGLRHCIVRPTLMFGWFDPKHLGWLSRFMERVPFFPIPGSGRYVRQPLYIRDLCKVLAWCANNQPDGRAYDIVGKEQIDYIDIIRAIKRYKGLKTPIVNLPVPVFAALMRAYGLFTRQPPFTVDQLQALMAGDFFTGVNLEQEFGIVPTPFEEAIRETFCTKPFCDVVLKL